MELGNKEITIDFIENIFGNILKIKAKCLSIEK